jgi:hypothetical protein
MTDIQIRINGLGKLLDRLDPKLEQKIPRLVSYLSNYMENKVRQNMDVAIYQRSVPWTRTGDLRQSVATTHISAYTHRVTVGKFYGIWVEGGTKHSKAYPFLKPAVEATRKEVPVAYQRMISL